MEFDKRDEDPVRYNLHDLREKVASDRLRAAARTCPGLEVVQSVLDGTEADEANKSWVGFHRLFYPECRACSDDNSKTSEG